MTPAKQHAVGFLVYHCVGNGIGHQVLDAVATLLGADAGARTRRRQALKLAREFHKLLRAAAGKRRQDRLDEEESLRNKASELAKQIVALTFPGVNFDPREPAPLGVLCPHCGLVGMLVRRGRVDVCQWCGVRP